MLSFRGGARAALLLVAAAGALATAPGAAAQPAPGAAIIADLKLNRDGVLEVVETISVPAGGQFRMSLPLRLDLGDGRERRFEVTDVATEGTGTTTFADDQFSIEANPGESTFRYHVRNTVGVAPESQVFNWVGLLNADVSSISATVIAPSYQMALVDCKLGPIGATRPCADVHIEPDGVLYLEQTGLRRGDAIDLRLQLPPNTVPANADVTEPGRSPFALSAPALIAFGVLLAALAGMAALVVRARRGAADDGTRVIDPLLRDGNTVQFTSPEGVLPGEAGLLLDEHADPVDLAATVVDLAVRRYLRITRIAEADWRIERVNPADDQLRDYERIVYETLLPAGADTVRFSELSAPGRMSLDALRAGLIADAVARGTFTDPRSRALPRYLGAALIAVGAAVTVVLALTAGHALVGVAIALGGVAALLLPSRLPLRTDRGRELAAQLRAMQRGLEHVRRDDVPVDQQELLFSRALPFTVVGGRGDHWIRVFGELDPTADGEQGLYWFGGFDRDRDLRRFAGHFPYFITALERLFGGGTR
ncbi:DUF2207 family protein [Nocardia harenae]|uniref:DUF2207 family protein n=1 Tax=Nocardia harenae TaxID=358707 RepID=UPI00082B1860|nr:DUF2207 domain-containing protein [Nocardia harenae]